MYPTKSMLDYMSEMNHCSRTGEFGRSDMFQSPTPSKVGLFNQSSMAQSSSSTETSPDSFPDLASHLFPSEFQPEARKFDGNNQWRREQQRHEHYEHFRPENAFETQIRQKQAFEGNVKPFDRHMHQEIPYGGIRPDLNNLVLTEHIYGTPLVPRRQRPIMGRKIMTTTEAPHQTNEFPMWQPDLPQTPPKSHKQNTQSNYELFPSSNRGFELPSPVKNSPPVTSPFQTSPRIPLSPVTSTPSVSPSPRSPFSSRMSTLFKEPVIGPNSSFSANYGPAKMCTFCRKNGETPLVYMTHVVKEKVGNKNVVTCPILRSHVCSICGVSGDNAHTITYCPVLRSSNNGQPLQSTTITLKNTRVKSNGRRRY